ncbi:MAG: hypothetical protein R3C68_05755 [Myxococcota bacterium]
MTKTGEVPCTLGRPIISNYGRCEFGDRILMNSRPVKIVISVDDAAELICGDDAF